MLIVLSIAIVIIVIIFLMLSVRYADRQEDNRASATEAVDSE